MSMSRSIPRTPKDISVAGESDTPSFDLSKNQPQKRSTSNREVSAFQMPRSDVRCPRISSTWPLMFSGLDSFACRRQLPVRATRTPPGELDGVVSPFDADHVGFPQRSFEISSGTRSSPKMRSVASERASTAIHSSREADCDPTADQPPLNRSLPTDRSWPAFGLKTAKSIATMSAFRRHWTAPNTAQWALSSMRLHRAVAALPRFGAEVPPVACW